MKLSEHFTLAEFTFSQTAMRKNIDNTPSPEIISNLKRVAHLLEQVRSNTGAPIRVSSGYRSKELNKVIGGSDTSAHTQGYAVDFNIPNMTPREVAKSIRGSGLKFDQLILEGVTIAAPDGQWVHISIDPKMRGEVLTMLNQKGKIVYKKGLV